MRPLRKLAWCRALQLAAAAERQEAKGTLLADNDATSFEHWIIDEVGQSCSLINGSRPAGANSPCGSS